MTALLNGLATWCALLAILLGVGAATLLLYAVSSDERDLPPASPGGAAPAAHPVSHGPASAIDPRSKEEAPMAAEPEGDRELRHLRNRLPVDLPATLTLPGAPLQAGRVVNLTRTGLFVATPTPAEVGTTVGVTFTLPLPAGASRVAAIAEVRWVNDVEAPQATALPPGMGLQFVSLEPEGRDGLVAFLAERLAALTRGVGHPVAAWSRPVFPRP
jgi:hypothetical protein